MLSGELLDKVVISTQEMLAAGAIDDERLPPSYLEDETLYRTLRQWFEVDAAHSSTWRREAREDFDFVANEQWDETTKRQLEAQQRPVITFNRVLSVIKAVAGIEINGRHETIFIPRGTDQGDVQINEFLTQASQWMSDGCDAEDEESEAFQDALVCGMGFTESVIDYESDPEGKYIEIKVDPLEMYWDRNARSKNLIDAQRIWRVRRMQLEEARSFVEGLGVNVPDSELSANWASLDGHDADLPRPIEDRRLREENVALPHDPRAEVFIVQVQWWERERYWRVADIGSPQTQDLTEDEFKTFKQRAASIGIDVIAVPMTRRVYKQAFLGRSLLGPVRRAPAIDRFSFTCITGEKKRNKGTWFGLVRLMRDPQMWANKWLSQTLHILNTTAKGGIIAEQDAFEDQRQAEASYAQPDAITWAAQGAIQKGKIMQKPGVGIPTAYVNLLEFAITSIRDVTGINMELLGMRDANQPGILEAQRKQAALTILATMFDSLRRFRKEIGRIRLQYIQNYLSDGRLIRIAGPDGEGYQIVPLLRDKTIGQYDVIVDDAPTSPNQKDQTWGMLMQLMPVFKGMMTPEAALVLLEYSPLPSKVVQAFKRLMEKPNPVQEQQQQLMLAHAQGEVQKLQSESAKNAADVGLKQAQAEKARVDAVIGMAQAASEAATANLEQSRADFMRQDMAQDGGMFSMAENPFIVTPPQNMGQTTGQLPGLPSLPTATEAAPMEFGAFPEPAAPPTGPVPNPGEAGGGLPI
jgi:hypothetical protein